MIDLVLVKFLRDHTPYQAGMIVSFSPAVAENFKKARVVEILGPMPSEDQSPKAPEKSGEKDITKRTTLKVEK